MIFKICLSFFKKLTFLFLFLFSLSQSHAQEIEEQKPWQIDFRAGLSFNYFSYEPNFFTPLKDLRPGASFGLILGKKWSGNLGYRIEPFLAYQALANRYKWNGNETKTSFSTLNTGVDLFPLIYQKDNSPFHFGLGLFGKYALITSSESSLNGSPYEGQNFEINKFQIGSILSAGYRIGNHRAELRYYYGFGDYVELNRTEVSVNSISLIYSW